MSELSDIAAKVAKALGLKEFDHDFRENHTGIERAMFKDGSNLFDPYWQVRCRDWLLERGTLSLSNSCLAFVDFGWSPAIVLHCPASEFCARAIARILDTPSNKTPESPD